MSPYWRLAPDFPHEWKTLVNLVDSVEDDVRSNGTSSPRNVGLTSHACELCGKCFATEKQLASHK
eukprot:11858201-Karenia_brevis.AAC.1